MDINVFRAWSERSFDLFSYVNDPEGYDNWRSYADNVIQSQPYTGDCDDLASTILDLLGRAGLKLENRYFMAVKASSDGSGHAVGCVMDDEGKFWIVGDTFSKEPYPAEQMRHTPDVYHRQSEIVTDPKTGKVILQWRDGAPFELKAA